MASNIRRLNAFKEKEQSDSYDTVSVETADLVLSDITDEDENFEDEEGGEEEIVENETGPQVKSHAQIGMSEIP